MRTFFIKYNVTYTYLDNREAEILSKSRQISIDSNDKEEKLYSKIKEKVTELEVEENYYDNTRPDSKTPARYDWLELAEI